MAYGLKVYNGFDEVVVDDGLVSLVKRYSGTANPTVQSGNSVTVYDSTGKGADPYTSTFPYSDEIWGGTRKTLYFYPVNLATFPYLTRGPLFTKMDVGGEQYYGRPSRKNGDGSPKSNEVFALHNGIISTRSTLPWAIIDQRDINVAPTGFGMAIYAPDGKCRWSADDQLAWVPYMDSLFDTHVSSTITQTYGGWIHATLPIIFAFDGPGGTTIYGRFVRTAAGVLDYIVDPYYAVNYYGYPNPPTDNMFTGWRPPLMLGTMG